jgi:hypothetical protein
MEINVNTLSHFKQMPLFVRAEYRHMHISFANGISEHKCGGGCGCGGDDGNKWLSF